MVTPDDPQHEGISGPPLVLGAPLISTITRWSRYSKCRIFDVEVLEAGTILRRDRRRQSHASRGRIADRHVREPAASARERAWRHVVHRVGAAGSCEPDRRAHASGGPVRVHRAPRPRASQLQHHPLCEVPFNFHDTEMPAAVLGDRGYTSSRGTTSDGPISI